MRVAFAHTFFVAPVLRSRLGEPMWCNLREIRSTPRERVTVGRRVGAMTGRGQPRDSS